MRSRCHLPLCTSPSSDPASQGTQLRAKHGSPKAAPPPALPMPSVGPRTAFFCPWAIGDACCQISPSSDSFPGGSALGFGGGKGWPWHPCFHQVKGSPCVVHPDGPTPFPSSFLPPTSPTPQCPTVYHGLEDKKSETSSPCLFCSDSPYPVCQQLFPPETIPNLPFPCFYRIYASPSPDDGTRLSLASLFERSPPCTAFPTEQPEGRFRSTNSWGSRTVLYFDMSAHRSTCGKIHRDIPKTCAPTPPESILYLNFF